MKKLLICDVCLIVAGSVIIGAWAMDWLVGIGVFLCCWGTKSWQVTL